MHIPSCEFLTHITAWRDTPSEIYSKHWTITTILDLISQYERWVTCHLHHAMSFQWANARRERNAWQSRRLKKIISSISMLTLLVCATQLWIVIMNVRATWERTLDCIRRKVIGIRCIALVYWFYLSSTSKENLHFSMQSKWKNGIDCVYAYSILIFSILVFVEWIIFLFMSLFTTKNQRPER